MSTLVPDKTIAEGSGSGAIALGGRARDGKRSYVQYEIFAGGVGGRNGKDGASATSFHLSNGKVAPVEIIESEFPTRVERFELLPDSGGPGRHRGGLGFVREYRILQDEVRFSMRTDKHALAPQGIAGGHPGGTGSCVINPGGKGRAQHAVAFRRPAAEQRRRAAGGAARRWGGLVQRSSGTRRKCWRTCGKDTCRWEKARGDYGVAVRTGVSEFTLDSAGTDDLRGKKNGG